MFERINVENHDLNHQEVTRDIRTMRSFIESGELVPGRQFVFANGEAILIGHATPQRQPSNDDGGIGWDYSEWEDRIVVRVVNFDLNETVYDAACDGEFLELCDVLENTLRSKLV